MGKMSRDKGKVGEREVAMLLREYGFEARRGQQFKGGPGSPDVVHSIPNVHIEVKRTERLQLYEALRQATFEASPEKVPVVFHRRNNQPWVVVMDAQDFLDIMQDLQSTALGAAMERYIRDGDKEMRWVND